MNTIHTLYVILFHLTFNLTNLIYSFPLIPSEKCILSLLLEETSSLNLLLAWVDQCSPTFQQNNKLYDTDRKNEWVRPYHADLWIYVLDTVHNDCNKIKLWAGTAWPTGTTGEHFFFTVGKKCCRGQGSGTLYMGQIRFKWPTLKWIHCYIHIIVHSE